MSESFRENILLSFGAESNAVNELLDYNRNRFDMTHAVDSLKVPLEDEKFVAYWQLYKIESEKNGVFDTLKQKLVQLQFPIRLGVSQSEGYLSATRRGSIAEEFPEESGLVLKHPELLELHLHPTLAGTIPVLISRCREDFVTLLRAFIHKNEPAEVPEAMGACMIAGLNNWDRIRSYRKEWEETNPTNSWNEEFRNLIQRKELYQDSFILLNDGPYSAVRAECVGLEESVWREKSLIIRMEHESTHYLTRRFFSSMQMNMFDELIADYAGLVAANGVFEADLFLTFIGLENHPDYRQGARMENYCKDKFKSESSFFILQSLIVAAARNIEAADKKFGRKKNTNQMVFALCSLTLEELASEETEERLERAISKYSNYS